MRRIIGIDPGSVVTGYGIIDSGANQVKHVASGCLKIKHDDFPMRLRAIFEGLGAVIEEHRPEEMAVEQVFVNKNVSSALKLGQARGAAICAGAAHDLPVGEYTPASVKQAIVGRGRADKQQVQYMVKVLLNIKDDLQEDAADALAVALCHAHSSQTEARTRAALGT